MYIEKQDILVIILLFILYACFIINFIIINDKLVYFIRTLLPLGILLYIHLESSIESLMQP